MGKQLDLSQFKKVRSGKKHTVLRHPSGHEITVFHSKLSEPVRKQLDNLPQYAEGGEVEDPIQKGQDSMREAFKMKPKQKPTPPIAAEDKYEAIRRQNKINIGYAEGGQVPPPTPIQSAEDSMRKAFHFAEGGSPEQVQGEEMSVPASKLESNYAAEEAQAQGQPQSAEGEQWANDIGQEIPNVDPNAPISPAAPKEDMSHAHLSEALKNLSSKFVSAPQAPAQEAAQPMAQAPQQVPDPGQPQGGLISQAKQDVNLASKAEQAAAGNVQQAQAQNAEIYGQKAEHMQALHQKYEEIGNNLHQKYEDLADQVSKGHIDPNQWWNSKSTGSKVLTAIGMMFAGAGAGASGHPEMVSKIIDESIQRDIDAQKADLSNKNSLLGKYMEMYNNLPQAEAAARLTLEASTEGLINQQAAKLGSQNALNQATIMNAKRRQDLLPQLEGLAKGQAMIGMYNEMAKPQPASGPEAAFVADMNRKRMLLPDQGKLMEARYLPGVGVASREIPDKIREELITRKDLSEKIAELENFARQHSGTILDRKIVNQGKALAANVQDAYRRGNQQGVFKPSEAEFVNKSIDQDPTSFFSKYRTIPGYQVARKLNEDTVKLYQKSYGVKPFQSQQGNQNQAAMEWLKANPNDPRAEAVRKKLGM